MRLPGLVLVVLALFAVAGCGAQSGKDKPGAPAARGGSPAPAASGFPAPRGRSLASLRAKATPGPALAPSVSLLHGGRNRFGFALFTGDGRPLAKPLSTAIYVAGGRGGSTVRGPFPARIESLDVPPAFRSRTTASDPDAARLVYVADAAVPRAGAVQVMAMSRVGGRLVASDVVPMKVTPRGAGPPDVGDPALKVSTPTLADVGGDAARIDTRVPPAPDLHRVDFADVVGRRPTVLLFATPQLCQSKVCGPVVDVAEAVRARVGERVAFVHQEIYRDNRIERGFTAPVQRWRLPSEPWAFVIDARGRVAERLEGAFSIAELERAVARVAPG